MIVSTVPPPFAAAAGDVFYESGVTLPVAIYFVAGLVLIVVCVGLLSVSSRRAWSVRTAALQMEPESLDPEYVRRKRFVHRHRGCPPEEVTAYLDAIADRIEGRDAVDTTPPAFGSVHRGWDTREVARFLTAVGAGECRDG